jgi:hypothetical protein
MYIFRRKDRKSDRRTVTQKKQFRLTHKHTGKYKETERQIGGRGYSARLESEITETDPLDRYQWMGEIRKMYKTYMLN